MKSPVPQVLEQAPFDGEPIWHEVHELAPAAEQVLQDESHAVH